MQFERFYSLNQSVVAWFAHLHQVGFQRKHLQYLFPPKYHLLVLLGKQVDVIWRAKLNILGTFSDA
jgi:hypothetical protein